MERKNTWFSSFAKWASRVRGQYEALARKARMELDEGKPDMGTPKI
jgi:hypothetical protein